MRVTRHKRQILLFLFAILVPAGVLIGLAGRIVYQDRELAGKRAVDQRRAAVDQLRRELSSRLEAIELQEINRLIRSPNPNWAGGSGDPAVIFTARVENDQLVLPWESASQPDTATSTEFAEHRQAGEAAEFIKKDYATAAAAYRLALASAQRPRESAEARLLLARTLIQGRRHGGSIPPVSCSARRFAGGQGRTRSRLPLLRRGAPAELPAGTECSPELSRQGSERRWPARAARTVYGPHTARFVSRCADRTTAPENIGPHR